MHDETLVRSLDRTLRTHTVFGLAVVALLVVGLGGWSALTGISGAVVAPGSVVNAGVKLHQFSGTKMYQ